MTADRLQLHDRGQSRSSLRCLSLAVNVRRWGRAENYGDVGAGAATTAGLRPWFEAASAPASVSVWSMGISEAILPRPSGLNSRRVDASLLLARRELLIRESRRDHRDSPQYPFTDNIQWSAMQQSSVINNK